MSEPLKCVAIDPGNEESALVYFEADEDELGGISIEESVFLPNEQVRKRLKEDEYDVLLIETPKARGMPTSNEEMETLIWIGRFFEFAQRRNKKWSMVWRADVKLRLCGVSSAKDANIRAALLEHFGGESLAIGGKKCRVCHGKTTLDGGRVDCTDCDGEGEVSGARGAKKCPTCKGKKTVAVGKVDCDRCKDSPGWETEAGPLKDIKSHAFAALGVAVTWLHDPKYVHRILPPGGNKEMAERRKQKKADKAARAEAKAAKAAK